MFTRPSILLGVLLFTGVAAAPRAADPSPLVVRPGDEPGRPVVVADLPPNVARQLGGGELPTATAGAYLRFVRLDAEGGREGPPVFGTYRLTGNTLRFEPEYRLGPGARYRATLVLPGRPPASVDYESPADVPAAAAGPPAVERVYPSADAVPANLLKFYVHFSRPMRPTERIFDQMHLIDEQGRPVHDPWRRLPQWSDDGRRLTLWIHPGRVKRGVNLREELGPVFVPGRRYRLRVDPTIEDLAGRPMGRPFETAFAATAEDHDRPAPAAWKLDPPRAATRDPLTVTFAEPLDHALLHRLLAVRDAAGRPVEGAIEVADRETTWRFSPAKPWAAEAHTLVADDLLEDLAGNTPVRVFDTDMRAAPQTRPATVGEPVSFRPR